MATGSAQYEHVQSRDNSRMHNGNNNNYNYTTNNTAFFHVPKKPPSDPIHAGLIRACAERARTPRLHYLLSQGADIDHTDGIGCTPLHHAVSSGSMETIRAVVNAGADVNAVDEWYGTPLCLASSRGNLEIVDFLIKSHADTKKHCGSLGSAAHAACARGDLPVMRALHAARANWKTERSVCVDAFCYLFELSQDNGTLVTYHKSLASRNYHIQSPGAMAVKYRHPEAVEFCFGLADGPSVNEAWKDARNPSDGKCAVTLLMLAMSTLDAGTAELLLKHGADAAAVDRTGRSALIYALRPFDLEVTDTADLKKCVGLLIRHVDIINHLHLINDETITVTDVARMLWDIVWWPGSVAVLASMLNDPSKWGMTALMHTIHRHSDHLSRVTCVKVLCELGANVKRRNIHRHSALDFARCYPPSTEKDEVMEILMRYA